MNSSGQDRMQWFARWFWRIHIVLVALLALGTGTTLLAYRYYGGEWSSFGIFVILFAVIPGLMAWALRARPVPARPATRGCPLKAPSGPN